jgi:cytidylate kinase
VIVTIDGPAGAGKSTVARKLAKRLGFRYLDTGAMYRAVALAGHRNHVDWNRPDDLADLSRRIAIRVAGDRVFLDGDDVTEAVRSSEVTAVTRFSAGNPRVREHLVDLQRAIAAGNDLVTEGRDQGTVVFPAAECKIYLTATPGERARRRVRDLEDQGETVSYDRVLADIERRDRGDATRQVGPLRKAGDAVEVITDGLSIDQVVERLAEMVEQCRTNRRSQ